MRSPPISCHVDLQSQMIDHTLHDEIHEVLIFFGRDGCDGLDGVRVRRSSLGRGRRRGDSGTQAGGKIYRILIHPMAFIPYHDDVPEPDRVPDRDNILRIHGIHSAVIRRHYALYAELMRGPGPVTRVQREMIAVAVSAANECHY